jgi:hypothetical protein
MIMAMKIMGVTGFQKMVYVCSHRISVIIVIIIIIIIIIISR